MTRLTTVIWQAALCVIVGSLLSACTSTQDVALGESKGKEGNSSVESSVTQKKVYSYTTNDRECLKRAMYFESRRTSEKGFLAVGSVIMNRLTSGIYPETICGVVSQKNQFAPGVMTRKMDESTAPELNEAADAVLKGARHPDVKNAMFFHTEGYNFPYKNMHYVAVAGGNAFYEKRDEDGNLQTEAPKPANSYILAYSSNDPEENPALSSSILADAAATTAQNTDVTTTPGAVLASEPNRGGTLPQMVAASANQTPSPMITAAIARSGVEEAFTAAYPASIEPANGSLLPQKANPLPSVIPTARPTVRKPQSEGMVMADQTPGLSQENWTMRTSTWQ